MRQLAGEKFLANVFGRQDNRFRYVSWNEKVPGAPDVIVRNLKTGERSSYSIGLQFGLGYFEGMNYSRCSRKFCAI